MFKRKRETSSFLVKSNFYLQIYQPSEGDLNSFIEHCGTKLRKTTCFQIITKGDIEATGQISDTHLNKNTDKREGALGGKIPLSYAQ